MGEAVEGRRRAPEKSVLHEAFRRGWPAVSSSMPSRVKLEVERFLTCGDLRFGFVEVTCETCAASRVGGLDALNNANFVAARTEVLHFEGADEEEGDDGDGDNQLLAAAVRRGTAPEELLASTQLRHPTRAPAAWHAVRGVQP